jgi:dolichol-phosphate mannosyltransferase
LHEEGVVMNVFLVIPTYDEAKNLERLVNQIFSQHPDFKIIIVDDNSPDGTGQIADAMATRDERMYVIHRPKKAGLGTAYVRGFQEALSKGADLIFEMDADFSHDIKYLKDFLEAAKS